MDTRSPLLALTYFLIPFFFSLIWSLRLSYFLIFSPILPLYPHPFRTFYFLGTWRKPRDIKYRYTTLSIYHSYVPQISINVTSPNFVLSISICLSFLRIRKLRLITFLFLIFNSFLSFLPYFFSHFLFLLPFSRFLFSSLLFSLAKKEEEIFLFLREIWDASSRFYLLKFIARYFNLKNCREKIKFLINFVSGLDGQIYPVLY